MCEKLTQRTLRADEIECRVQSVMKDGSGCVLLLYKDARCDQRILDEIFGAFNWQRRHYECKGNLFCEVGIKNPDTGEWVYKGDCGTESNTEKEKGEASDSFKRACFNWGIGRELYTSPFIYVKLNSGEASQSNGRYYLSPRVKFHVSEIGYNDNKEITKLVVADQTGAVRYTHGSRSTTTAQAASGKPAQPDYDPDLLLAKREMQEAKTMQEAVAVWDRWACFKHDEHFQREKERAKARLTMQQQSANQ